MAQAFLIDPVPEWAKTMSASIEVPAGDVRLFHEVQIADGVELLLADGAEALVL